MVSIRCFDVKPIVALVLVQFGSGGVSMFYKLASATGMKVQILVFYRLMFATFCLVPVAFLFERNSRPKLTCKIAFQGLACGILGGALGSNLYAEGLILTSATLATSMSNIIPALTMLLAIICGLERIDLRMASGKAKVIGTALGLSGAMLATFYKGPTVTLWSTNINIIKSHNNANMIHGEHHHLLGCFLTLLSCVSYAGWLIVQTHMSQGYPHFSSSAITCAAGAIVSGVYAWCREHTLQEWKLGFNSIRLISACYMGIIGSGFAVVTTAWAARAKGPLYVSSFAPLALVFVALIGSLVLGEKLNLGSVVGSVLIILGLYMVLRGKSLEMDIASSGSETNGEGAIGICVIVPTEITLEDKCSEAEGVVETEITSSKSVEEVRSSCLVLKINSVL